MKRTFTLKKWKRRLKIMLNSKRSNYVPSVLNVERIIGSGDYIASGDYVLQLIAKSNEIICSHVQTRRRGDNSGISD